MQIKNYDKEYKKEVENIFKLYWTDKEFLQELSDNLESKTCNFYIVEDNNEVEGVAGIRKVDNFLKEYASTTSPVELYIIASKNKNKGTGSALLNHVIEESKKMNYTEMICYSPETHDSSWRFYEKAGFIQHGIVNDPDDGYPGMILRRSLV